LLFGQLVELTGFSVVLHL